MPILKIPTVKLAESKIRLCRSYLHAIDVEIYELQTEHQQGELSQQELEEALILLNADAEKLRSELESTRILQRKQSAA